MFSNAVLIVIQNFRVVCWVISVVQSSQFIATRQKSGHDFDYILRVEKKSTDLDLKWQTLGTVQIC